MMNDLPKINSLIFFISVLFLASNCTREDPVEEVEKDVICGVADPVNDLQWLNDEFKQFLGGPEVNGIVLYKFNDQNVVEVQNSLFSSTNIHQYYCDGTKLNLEDPKAFADFKKNRIETKILYGVNLWKQLNL